MATPHYFQTDWIERSDHRLRVDVCVYGGNAAGVIAAHTAAAAGKSVVLVHPGLHLGGMTTGGLSYSDVGHTGAIGGRARLFYQRLAAHYRETRGFKKDITFVFEPKIASVILDRFIDEQDVTVITGGFLDRCLMTASEGPGRGPRIREMRLLGGRRVTADIFIDSSYEGDLMAAAGVSYTTGRESSTQYGEPINGFQMNDTHQFDVDIDPYREPGRPESGLLPELEHAAWYEESDIEELTGTGDKLIQAYNFRMCMEKDPSNQIPFPRPDGYDPARYELLARWLQATQRPYVIDGRFGKVIRKFDFITRTKTDTNNFGAVSTDYIGAGWDWPTGDYARREEIFQDHFQYQMGYHYFMANDPGVPDYIQSVYGQWGLARDEFVETNHWPHQLYVREGRRMVSDYVMTYHDCTSERLCEDSVAMGAYNMDSHNCRRVIVSGKVRNEGDMQQSPGKPYRISYRSCVPRKGECENLAVPVAVSASHIAFGSVRMEPVFMALAESMATAAVLAIDRQKPMQEIAYRDLEPELLSRGQVLTTPIERSQTRGNPDGEIV